MENYGNANVLSNDDLWERSAQPGELKAADLGIHYNNVQDGLEILTEGYLFSRTEN